MQGAAKIPADGRILVIIVAVYGLVQAALLGLSRPPEDLVVADALTFLRMTRQLLDSGMIVEAQRQPLFPLFAAGVFKVVGSEALYVIFALQAVLHFFTAWMTLAIMRLWLPNMAAIAFALVLLNPNAIGISHLFLADTLNATLMMAAVYWLLRYAARPGWSSVGWFGAMLGLAALTRPENIYLCYIAPIAVVLVALTADHPRVLFHGLLRGVAALAIGLALAGPWGVQQLVIEESVAATGVNKAYVNVRGHFALIEASRLNSIEAIQVKRLALLEPAILEDAGLATASDVKRNRALFRHYLTRIFTEHPIIVAKLYAKAWIAQFASGGGQTINQLLQIEMRRPDKIMNSENPLSGFLAGFENSAPGAIIITLASVLFALVLRMLGVVGLITMAARRHWPLLLVVVSVIVFKAIIHLFYGISRYRLPVEPLLMILAVYGIDGLWLWWNRFFDRPQSSGG